MNGRIIFLVHLLFPFSVLIFSCQSEMGAAKPSWPVINSEEKDPDGYRRFEFEGLSFCLPDYMTPAEGSSVQTCKYEALSRGEFIELSILPEMIDGNKTSVELSLSGYLEELLARESDRARSYKLLSLDSALLNGSKARIADFEVLHYGNPMRMRAKLVVLNGQRNFYSTLISRVIEENVATHLMDNVLTGLRYVQGEKK